MLKTYILLPELELTKLAFIDRGSEVRKKENPPINLGNSSYINEDQINDSTYSSSIKLTQSGKPIQHSKYISKNTFEKKSSEQSNNNDHLETFKNSRRSSVISSFLEKGPENIENSKKEEKTQKSMIKTLNNQKTLLQVKDPEKEKESMSPK